MILFTREPVAAGSFYPLSSQKLKEFLKNKIGPLQKGKGFLQGMVVPHAGYIYSGSIAALAYRELGKHIERTFVILGPNHTGLGEEISIMYKAAYSTPLGKVSVNQEIGRKLCKELNTSNDFVAHSREHSIEVQLPFLQYLYGEKLKIVPIVIGSVSFEKLRKLGSLLAKEDCTIIASSDFTHHGPAYGYVQGTPSEVKESDLKAIDFILNLKPKEFYDYASKGTICGFRPITALIQAMKEREAQPKFLKYGTSADVSGDYRNFVGYASLVFE